MPILDHTVPGMQVHITQYYSTANMFDTINLCAVEKAYTTKSTPSVQYK